jgi:FKBP-type peptidyl-prolyl cis-trans isomerase 2
MAQVKNGDTVTVHYTGRLEDGTVFDSSANRDPLQFTLGEDLLIPGFEQAVLGMSAGESKTVEVSADQAYGLHQEEMVVDIDRQEFPPHFQPKVGQQLQIPQSDSRVTRLIVTAVSEQKVTLDANHPLAGRDLTFDIQLLEIVQ